MTINDDRLEARREYKRRYEKARRQQGNDWRRKQLEANTPWAIEYRRKNNERSSDKYYTDKDYRERQIKRSLENTRRIREKQWQDHLKKVAARASSLRRKVEKTIPDQFGIIRISRSVY